MERDLFHRPGLQRRATSARRALGVPLALAALGLLPGGAMAQAETTADARALVLDPGSIVNVADIDFGQIAQPVAAGTVTLTPAPSATCTVTGGLVRSGPCQAAAFSVYGRKNWRARFRALGGGTIVLAGPGGATMTMTNVTFAATDMTLTNGAGAGWNLGRYQIESDSGVAMFHLGGTLAVGAGQAPGAYTGTLTIEAQFN